jgi:hypothetical protein
MLTMLSCNKDLAEIVLREVASDFLESPLHPHDAPVADDGDWSGDEPQEEEGEQESEAGERDEVDGAAPVAPLEIE